MRTTRTETVAGSIRSAAVTEDDLLRLIQPMEEAGWAVAQIIPTYNNYVVVFERDSSYGQTYQ